MTRAALLPLLLLSACGSSSAPPVASGSGENNTSAAAATSTSSTTPVDATTGARSSSPTSGPTSTSTAASESTEFDADSRSFINDDWDVPPWIECWTMQDDCPRGEKCSAYAYDGGSVWNGLKCVAVAPNPDSVGELCSVEGSPVSGLDTCVRGAMCWNVDGRTFEGTCIEYCQGTPNQPVCMDPWAQCQFSGSGTLSLCLPQCAPLEPATCAEDEICRVHSGGSFCSAPDPEHDGAAFEPCENLHECGGGLYCAPSESVEACEGAFGSSCCAPHCDIEAPDCAAPSVCIPAFSPDVMPVGLANIGYCGQETQ